MSAPDRSEFVRVREALMVHFVESPASRHRDRVEVLGRGGFTLVARFDALDWRVETSGEPSDDQVAHLSRADDLLQGRLVARIKVENPGLAARVEASGERHPWRPQFAGHRYE